MYDCRCGSDQRTDGDWVISKFIPPESPTNKAGWGLIWLPISIFGFCVVWLTALLLAFKARELVEGEAHTKRGYGYYLGSLFLVLTGFALVAAAMTWA